MIIVKILGGLGNQLFQYAAANALAEKNRTEVKVDLSELKKDPLRTFELNYTKAKFTVAASNEINKLKANNSLERIKERLIPYRFRRFYKQPHFHFDPRFFSLPDDVYIQGYFQSEEYFSSVGTVLKKEFVLIPEIPEHLKLIAKKISQGNSVSIHIRKGDYQDSELLRIHGILPVAYYLRAISFLQQKFNELEFYVFSDDPNLSLEEFNLSDSVYISGHYSKNHLEDFHLMSLCKHNIIANSSFSWWAAWLNPNPDKIVIAPKQWFNKGPKDTQDLLPESWIKL